MPVSVARRVLAAASLVAAVAPPLAAQTVTLGDLVSHLRPGTSVRVTVDGAPIDGDLEQVTPDALVLRRRQGGQIERLPADRLQRIRYHDSVVNGALTGLLVGAAPGIFFGVLVRTYCENEAGRCDAAPFVFGALSGAVGMGIGAGIDEMIRTTVRLGPARATATLGVVPDPRRPAARLSFRF